MKQFNSVHLQKREKSKICILLPDYQEINIFEGRFNRITFEQVYTKTFKCTYQLQLYPFDTQVHEKACTWWWARCARWTWSWGSWRRRWWRSPRTGSPWNPGQCSLNIWSPTGRWRTTTQATWTQASRWPSSSSAGSWTPSSPSTCPPCWSSSLSTPPTSSRISSSRCFSLSALSYYHKSQRWSNLKTFWHIPINLLLFKAIVTVNLTSLLVLTTLFISVSGALPQTAYVKMVGCIICLCSCMCMRICIFCLCRCLCICIFCLCTT